jgi:hypothetical protein
MGTSDRTSPTRIFVATDTAISTVLESSINFHRLLASKPVRRTRHDSIRFFQIDVAAVAKFELPVQTFFRSS